MAPDRLPEPVGVALHIARVLETLGVRYVTAGSLASSLHGEPRSTNDIDIVADLRAHHMSALALTLGADWVWSEDAARDAIVRGASFNAVHVKTALKVDVFVVGGDAFDSHRVATGRRMRLGDTPESETVMDTAEHTVVRKLEWFRRGGEVSDRQWRDVVGILRVQGPRIDSRELDTWAARLGVTDLLESARREATADNA
jgi:hypothetical protein